MKYLYTLCDWLAYLRNKLIFRNWVYLRNLLVILALDSLVVDDEPLWEPLEWSILQTWVIYIYIFAWIAETLFSSRYGAFTNRDKIVWAGLYKVYTYLKLWFILNIVFITLFVTMPFFFEITYSISYIVVWWQWFNSLFFFKFTLTFSLILILSTYLRLSVRLIHPRKVILLAYISLFVILYLFYFNAMSLILGYFTDINAFQKSGWSDSLRLVHGPSKWGWGNSSRENFSYHKTTTTFWYKNDPLIASSLLFLHIFIFKFLLFFIIQLITLVRVLYTSGEVSFTYINYFYISTREFYYFICSLGGLVIISLLYQILRFPPELFTFNKLFFLAYTFTEIILDIIFDILNY